MIEKQVMGGLSARPAWSCGAVGVAAIVLLGSLLSAPGAHAQSLTPPTLVSPTLAPTVVVVQAAVTAPPTIPVAGTSVAGATTAGAITSAAPGASGAKSSAASTSATSRYSDPLSDMAVAALDALRSDTTGTQQFASAQPVVTTAKTTPVTKPLVAQGGDVAWSSVVIDTAQLSDYLSGTAIVVPVSPTVSAALAALPTEPRARYAATLHSLAGIAAARAKVDAGALEAVWLRTDSRRMRTVLTAMAQVGTMYRAAGNQPGGFDCSGLTSYAWAQAGVKIPRTSGDQINAAAPRAADQLLPGDVVWHPGHIGLYLGVGDAMVHSPQTGKPVEVKGWGRAQRWGSPI